MATSKVTNCFNSIPTKEFDRIDTVASHLAKVAGRDVLNSDYIEVVRGLLKIEKTKLSGIFQDHAAGLEAEKTKAESKQAADAKAAEEKSKAQEAEAARIEAAKAKEESDKAAQEQADKEAKAYSADVKLIIEAVEDAKDEIDYASAMDALYKHYIEAPDGSRAAKQIEKYVDENSKLKSFEMAFLAAEKRYDDMEERSYRKGRSAKGTESKMDTETVDALAGLAFPRFSDGSLVAPEQQMSKETIDQLVASLGLPAEVEITTLDAAGDVPNTSVPVGTTPAGGVIGGKIYLFRNGLTDANHVLRTIFHELFHFGLKNVLPKAQYTQTMLKLQASDAKVAEYAKRWRGSIEGVERRDGMQVQDWNALSVEEALADIAEDLNSGDKLGTGKQGMVRNIAKWLADTADMLGMKKLAQSIRAMTYTQTEKFVQDSVKAAAGVKPSVQAESIPVFSTKRPAIAQVAERYAGSNAASVVDTAVHSAQKLVSSMRFLHDLVDSVSKTIPSAKLWHENLLAAVTTRNQMEADAEKIATDAIKLKNGTDQVNKFLSESTFAQKWGYKPDFRKDAVIDPALAQKFNALSAAEQKVVKDVFAHGEKMANMRQELLLSMGLDKAFGMSMSKMDGPYSPFKRFGNYWGVLKSQELLDAEAASDTKLADELKTKPEHFMASTFDTIGQAKQFAFANDIANGGKYHHTDAWEKSTRTETPRTMPANVLSKVMAAIKVTDDVEIPAEVRQSMVNMINNMYLQSLDEQNARTSSARRMNRAGYDADMIRSFLSNAKAEAGLLANLKHGADINDAFYHMQTEVKDTKGKRVNADDFNALSAHYAASMDYKETPWQDRIMAGTSAWQLATSIGYHVANAMQGIMVTLPKLAADFNDYGGAWKHLTNGYNIIKDTGFIGNINLTKVQSPGLRAALQRASDMGVLDIGMDEDLTHFNQSRTGIKSVDKASAVAASALHKLRSVSRAVETANRLSSATAAYNMAIEKGQSVKQAQDYAVKILQDTQGDFSRMGAPLLFKKMPKIIMQYRKFQFMTAALYAKAFHQAFQGTTPEEKAIGRRMLAYKMFHTGMAAGVLGMPLMNLVMMVFGALGKDNEPKDLERSLREWVGDDDLANMLTHGPMSMLGLDMSAKIGEDKIFSIMPYGKWDFSSAKGLKDTVFSLAGPSVSQAGKMANGIGAIGNGDYYKGIEQLMPKGVADSMKAFRIGNEGYTLKNGDVMFNPADINGFALALDAVGLPSAEMKRMDWVKNQQYEINDFYSKQSKKIEQEYARAIEEKDTSAQAEYRQQWADLQTGKTHLRSFFQNSPDYLKTQPLSTLIKYPRSAEARQNKLQRASKAD